jgi:hypothetical protein
MRGLRTLAAIVGAAVFAGVAAAGGIDPHDFEVNLQAPPIKIDENGDVVLNGLKMSGTVRERSGRNGTIGMVCDLELHAKSSGGSFRASGTQRCSWSMQFPDGSLNGTMEGSNSVDVGPSGGTQSSTMTVTVVDGNGAFDGQVGSGTYSQKQDVAAPPSGPPPGSKPPPTPPPTGPPPSGPPPQTPPPAGPPPPVPPAPPPGNVPPPPPGPPPGAPPAGPPPPVPPLPPAPPPPPPVPPPPFFALRVPANVTAKPKPSSQLKLRLRAGKPAAKIASPGPKLTEETDGGLRVVSASGATCSAVAKGAKTVSLGSARDTNKDGLVVIVPKLRAKLGAGGWSLVVTCSYPGGKATASSRVSIT